MVAIIQRLILPLLGMVPLVLPVQAGSNLLENSPFLPPNLSAAGAAPDVNPINSTSSSNRFIFSLPAGRPFRITSVEVLRSISSDVCCNLALVS